MMRFLTYSVKYFPISRGCCKYTWFQWSPRGHSSSQGLPRLQQRFDHVPCPESVRTITLILFCLGMLLSLGHTGFPVALRHQSSTKSLSPGAEETLPSVFSNTSETHLPSCSLFSCLEKNLILPAASRTLCLKTWLCLYRKWSERVSSPDLAGNVVPS